MKRTQTEIREWRNAIKQLLEFGGPMTVQHMCRMFVIHHQDLITGSLLNSLSANLGVMRQSGVVSALQIKTGHEFEMETDPTKRVRLRRPISVEPTTRLWFMATDKQAANRAVEIGNKIDQILQHGRHRKLIAEMLNGSYDPFCRSMTKAFNL